MEHGQEDRRFRIAGGAPGMRVSWQVTGVRRDAYAERGRYPHPSEHGMPAFLGLDAEPARE